MPLNLEPTASEKLSAAINARIDAALEAQDAAEPIRDYLGGSIMGEECFRKLYYKVRVPKAAAPRKGRFVRRTLLGRLHEDLTAEWLAAAGFDLRRNPEDNAFELALKGGKVAGHYDGDIHGLPPDLPVELPAPILWEHKIMKAEYWRAFQSKGVAVSHPTYHAQCVVYSARSGRVGVLFTALNTDTSELWFEYVPADPHKNNHLFMRADKVLSAATEYDVPRIATVETDFKCRFCDFHDHCWRPQERPAAKPVLPSWVKR